MELSLGLIGIGAVLGLAACGSALGTGIASMAAIGAWKKCYAQNRPAPFILAAFVGAPLTQTIYGMILMGYLTNSPANPGIIMGVGIFGGLGIGFSAWLQGKAAAAACDAYGETGKGTAQYLTVIGIVETVALFAMVFLMGVVS